MLSISLEAGSRQQAGGGSRRLLAEVAAPPGKRVRMVDFLAEVGCDPVYGARPLQRTIQKSLENNIALGLLKGEYADGDTIVVTVMNERIHVRKAQPWEVAAVDSSGEMSNAQESFAGGNTSLLDELWLVVQYYSDYGSLQLRPCW